jgi:hypothetical protein
LFLRASSKLYFLLSELNVVMILRVCKALLLLGILLQRQTHQCGCESRNCIA